MKSLMVCLMGLMVFVQAGTVQQPTVSGQVRLSDGLPVVGAQVILFDLADLRRGVVAREMTDESGNFALPLVPSLPEGFVLGANYPNPFNPSTIIPYELAVTAQVRLEVFNTLGQRMATLVNGEQGAGTHSAQWDGTDAAGRAAAAGMYLYRLTVDGVEQTGRMVLVDGQAGVPMRGASAEALPMTEVPSSTYGLVVSGLGLVTYVDADFGVEAGMGPVDVEVEAWQNVRMKVAQTPNGILGDVNNNGQVDIDDGLLVAAYYANSSTPMPNNGDISLGDVNCNGQVDLTDARLITTYIINPSDPSVQSLSIGQAGGCDTPDGGGSPEATKMYWADGGRSEQKIQRANLDGSQVEDLVTGLGGIDGLALDASGGKIYWTERSDKKIRRANLDGSQVEDLVTGLDQPIEVALDVSRGKIYWVDYSRGKIQCANLDGSQVEDLISANGPHGIALDVSRGKIYWVAYGKIQRANLDGSQVEDVVTGVNWSPSGIALDVSGGKMYWTDSRNNKIQRSNLDGSQVEDVVTGLDEPRQVALDVSGGKMYWTEAAGGTIGRSNLDGSQVEDLVTGLGYPRGIALQVSDQTQPPPPSETPDLVVTASAPSSVTAGQSFTLSATVSNRGTAASAETTMRYYRSSDETIGDDNDTQVGSDQAVSSLAAGTSTGELETPVTAPDTADTYYYGACVDAVSGDSNRNNDCSPGVQVNVIVQADLPDLQVSSGDVVDGNDEPTPGSTIKLEFTVRNSRSASVSAPETILRYYMSDNETLDANDQTMGDITISALGVGEKREVVTDNITVPSPYIETAYYYFACLDPDNLISERDETDNCSDEVVIDVAGSGPADLAVINPWVSKYDISPSDTLRFYVTVRNLGPATTPKDIEGIVTYYYSSNNSTWNPVLTSRGEKSQTEIRDELEPEKDDEENRKIKVPSTEGTYYYRACVEIENEDPNSDNNCSDSVAVNVRTGASGLPDLIVKNPEVGNSDSASGNISAGDQFRMRVTLVNEGSVVPAKNFKLIYYRSNDNVWSNDDTQEHEESIGASTLPPRDVDGDRKSTLITVPSTAGTYYYIACVDPQNNIPESKENNNCASVTIYVGAPDLFFESVSVSNPSPVEGGDIEISVSVRNKGPGEAFDAELKYYRSNDNTLDTTNDTYLGETHDYTISRLGPDDSPKEHSTFPFPAPSTAGTYYYFACVETTGDSNPSNNCSSVRVSVQPPDGPGVPDLVVRNARVDNSTPLAGSTIGMNVDVYIQGSATKFSSTLHYRLLVISGLDVELGIYTVSLDPGETRSEYKEFPVPSAAGTYYYEACVDTISNENDTKNNCSRVRVDVEGGPPTARNAGKSALGQNKVAWSRVSDATYYKVYHCGKNYDHNLGKWSDEDEQIHETEIDQPDNTNASWIGWTDSISDLGGDWYKVKACNDNGCSDFSNEVIFDRSSEAKEASIATWIKPGNDELSWGPGTEIKKDYFAYYKIFRAKRIKLGHILVHTTGILSYRWRDTTSHGSGSYFYVIQGCDADGNCGEEQDVLPRSIDYPGDPPSPPASPRNLNGSTENFNVDINRLDWEPPSSGISVTHYEVWHKSRRGGEYSLKGKQVIDTYWYDTDAYGDPDDSSGDDYYKVKACNEKGCSDFSDEVKIE